MGGPLHIFVVVVVVAGSGAASLIMFLKDFLNANSGISHESVGIHAGTPKHRVLGQD